MFSITRGKGFQITFENGYTASVQFGYGNYTENYDIYEMGGYKRECKNIKSGIYPETRLAETAIKAPNGALIEYDGGDVQGYRTPEQVLELLNYVKNIK